MTASDGLETGGPLAGRRIVVTRAPGQAGRLSALLAAAGATVIEVPLIRIEPVDSASVELVTRLTQALAGDARVWVVVTSPNGAACVSRALSELDAAPDPGPGAGLDPGLAARIRIAAVGGGTKEAIGRPVDLVPERQVAEGLLAEFPPPGPNSTRVVLVQGDLARPILADGLRAAGWNVDQVVAYRNRPNQPPPDVLAEMEAADAITFTSGSTVRSFVAATAGRGRPPVAVSIGPITTQVAEELGLPIARTASDHSLDGLVAALAVAVAEPHADRDESFGPPDPLGDR
ncbi:MAG: uroporphyrinogen-III synthase [Ilumatobacteraceae bacterium]